MSGGAVIHTEYGLISIISAIGYLSNEKFSTSMYKIIAGSINNNTHFSSSSTIFLNTSTTEDDASIRSIHLSTVRDWIEDIRTKITKKNT